MKKFLWFSMMLLFTLTALCDEKWSEGVYFDGSEIKEEALQLLTTDLLAYSSALAKGVPQSLTITVEDKKDATKKATLFSDESGEEVEGTITWDYTDEKYKDFTEEGTYLLKETVTSEEETKVFTRTVTILPEPAALLIFFGLGCFFLKKRERGGLLVGLLVLGALAFSSLAKAEDGIISEVSCLQILPFSRSVSINYTLTSSNEAPVFIVNFYGTLDDGETVFDLSEKGVLEREGVDGIVAGAGAHKTLWTPDESFFEAQTENFKVKVEAYEQALPPAGEYLVIDLSGGPEATSFPVSALSAVPAGGWTEEYKTTKLVLKKIAPGTFNSGSPAEELGRSENEVRHAVSLTKTFYAGVFEVTQKQFELVTGVNPALFVGDARPVERVSYNLLRGDAWPESEKIEKTSFFGILRAKTRMAFDLPTEGMWEFACRAGTETALNDGNNLTAVGEDENLNSLARYWYDGGGNTVSNVVGLAHAVVGSYAPNAWGLYDMHGNVLEWCLDWYQANLGTEAVTDPIGPASADYRVLRGGCSLSGAEGCRAAARDYAYPNFSDYSGIGFRVFLRP